MTWSGFSGIMAEVQLSLDDGFKSEQDNYNWLYNSDVHASSFTFSGTTGSLGIPSSMLLKMEHTCTTECEQWIQPVP